MYNLRRTLGNTMGIGGDSSDTFLVIPKTAPSPYTVLPRLYVPQSRIPLVNTQDSLLSTLSTGLIYKS